MLRIFLFIVALLMISLGALASQLGGVNAWPTTICGTVLLIALLFEKHRYQQPPIDNLDEWEKTDEQFIDPDSGKLKQVYYHPSTGDRRYVDISDAN